MKKKTATELRTKAKERQKAVRERKKALGLKQLNVWIDKDAFKKLLEVKKILKHDSNAQALECAIYLLGRRADQHIRDMSDKPPGSLLLDD